MRLYEVYLGRQSWDEFLSNSDLITGLETELAKEKSTMMQVGLSQSDYQIALESGLGALGTGMASGVGESKYNLEFSLEKLAEGLDQLNADFHILLGDFIWKIEMHHETLSNILLEIRLAEFEREARAYRSRAEVAYFNGWYEEALNDFLEAEKRNYPDFAVHRSIANICFYHLINLPRASEYFSKAAKYARPSDARQSAEAHYFAGIACAVQNHLDEGLEHLRQAVALNPLLYEAYYQMACLAAVLRDDEMAVASLEPAIKGDPRYYERAKDDQVFDPIRTQVQALLDRLMEPVQQELAQLKQDAELLKKYVIARPEKKERISSLFQSVEQESATAKTYKAGLHFLETLLQAQHELKEIYDLFYRQYKINTYDYVRSVAFSPDGRLLASGFLKEGIKVWEVDTGLKVQSFDEHTESVNSVAFSPNNQWLVSGSRDRTIRLWDVETGKALRTLIGHYGEVSAVTFSPDGQWIASGSHDRTVRIWRAVTGREVLTLAGHTHYVTSTVFGPDGEVIASGSLDKTIKLWDAESGREIQTLLGHTLGVVSIAFSPDGRWLASGGEDKKVKIWDVAAGREAQSLSGHHNDVTSLAFSPDGKLLAAGSLGQTIRVWRLDTGQLVKTLWYNEISWHPVAFSPKGQWLALASRDLQLWLKAILTEEEYAEVKAGEERALQFKQEEYWMDAPHPDHELIARAQAAKEKLKAQRRDAGQCEVCGTKLKLFERIGGYIVCKAHRLR